jgi:cytochrome c(L)
MWRRSSWCLAAVILVIALWQSRAPAIQEAQKPVQGAQAQSQQPQAPAAAVAQGASVAKRNPFTGNEEAIKEGRTIYLQSGCSGCHGMGGGGMGPALLDDEWKWGGDDETLFKLIRGDLPQQTMPAVFGKVLTEEQVWKIIAWIRSIYKGDPARVKW